MEEARRLAEEALEVRSPSLLANALRATLAALAKAEQELATYKEKLDHVDEVLVNALTDRRDLTHSDMQELLGMIRWKK
jgi:dsRNA-specific ribonuclease